MDKIKEHERYRLLDTNNPDVARVAIKASGRLVVWDRIGKEFLLCDELLHNIFYKADALEEIEQLLDEEQCEWFAENAFWETINKCGNGPHTELHDLWDQLTEEEKRSFNVRTTHEDGWLGEVKATIAKRRNEARYDL